MEEKSLAFEMLQEIKRSNKRWFIIAIVELIIIIGMIIGFLVYESQYEYGETDEIYQYVDNTEMENSTINQNLGE